jgi:hypothetical protein
MTAAWYLSEDGGKGLRELSGYRLTRTREGWWLVDPARPGKRTRVRGPFGAAVAAMQAAGEEIQP